MGTLWVSTNPHSFVRRWVTVTYVLSTAVAAVLVTYAIGFFYSSQTTSASVYKVSAGTGVSIVADNFPLGSIPFDTSFAEADEVPHVSQNQQIDPSLFFDDRRSERFDAVLKLQAQPFRRYRGPLRQRTFDVYPIPKGGFRRNGKIIYYLHVHKAGGTTMCQAAKFNRLRASYSTNCNVQRDQRCCGRNDTKEEMALFANSTPYEFVANERDLFRTMDHEHYHYIIILRDSESRYKAHWKHLARERNKKHRSFFSTWWRHQPDNWTTRKICGIPCSNIPKFQLNRTIFDDTLNRLMQFDNVLFLEHFEESYLKFASQVGWKQVAPPPANVAKPNAYYPPLGDPWDPLMSALDDVLYEAALNMYFHENMTNVTLSENALKKLDFYWREGPSRNCTEPCCSINCSQYR